MGLISLNPKKVIVLPIGTPISGDDIPRILVPRAFRIEEIRALKLDQVSGSVDLDIRFDPDASQTGGGTLLLSVAGISNNTTGQQFLPPFAGGSGAVIVPADNHVWPELSNVSTGLARPTMFEVHLIGIELGA